MQLVTKSPIIHCKTKIKTLLQVELISTSTYDKRDKITNTTESILTHDSKKFWGQTTTDDVEILIHQAVID